MVQSTSVGRTVRRTPTRIQNSMPIEVKNVQFGVECSRAPMLTKDLVDAVTTRVYHCTAYCLHSKSQLKYIHTVYGETLLLYSVFMHFPWFRWSCCSREKLVCNHCSILNGKVK